MQKYDAARFKISCFAAAVRFGIWDLGFRICLKTIKFYKENPIPSNLESKSFNLLNG
jgi:hypothetical protein